VIQCDETLGLVALNKVLEKIMRKLVLILIAFIAAVTFIRSLDSSLKADEGPVDLGAAATASDLQTK
jgi:hypothetical protein